MCAAERHIYCPGEEVDGGGRTEVDTARDLGRRLILPEGVAERKKELATTVRFYRIRSNVNPLLGSTITRSKVIVSTLLMSTILRSTQNDLHQNCFYIINFYRS